MIIIDCEQGSPEWLILRKNKITATDASVILGVNPFKPIKKLWQEKWGLIAGDPMNAAMERGQKLEPIARKLANESLGYDFVPIVATHDIDQWCMASLDGYDHKFNVICEIKCPGLDTHNLALEGQIKEYYTAQIQHQLHVTGASLCMYISYNPDAKEPFHVISVMPDKEYIEHMIKKEEEFYCNHMLEFVPPAGPEKLKKKNAT